MDKMSSVDDMSSYPAKILRERNWTIAKSGSQVLIYCENSDDALAVFNWLTEWDLACIVERIQKPKQYRPFANAAEFAPHRDRWVSIQINGMLTKPVSYNDDRLFVGDMWFLWSDAFTHLRFDDGSEFGVEVA